MKWIDSYDLDKTWAGRRDCQEKLPLLVRKLIRATSTSIRNIKFPAGENVLIGGWDGILEVGEATEYLPAGISLWEFGADRYAKGKAEREYIKRTAEPLGYDPAESTFVFVTPRLWKKAGTWATEKKKEGVWKDIRVINSEILEEWIEVAPTVGSWLSKHLGKYPEEGIQPTDDFWEQWCTGEKLKLNADILLGGRSQAQEAVIELYNQSKIIAVQSLSREESLAFIIACFISRPDKSKDFLSRSIIVDNIESFKKLVVHGNPLILIPRFEDNGIINSALKKEHTVIVPLGADSMSRWSDKISLPPIERESFVAALMNSGLTKEFAEKYSKETARNITILRRQLEFNRTLPQWASPENVHDVLPAMVVGRWDENFENDKRIISRIASDTYENYIKRLSRWIHTHDSPIVKIGSTWYLTSPLDAWSNASINLTRGHFDSLKSAALDVLAEINPAFELEPEQRYMASIYGKNWKFSEMIREGLVQSLILTSVFGDKLQFDLPVKAEIWIDTIIAILLSTNNPSLWKSIDSILPLIAEASPASFLNAIEKHLSNDTSPIIQLFDEDPGLITPHCYHTGLLWALEGLAWFPKYFSRASLGLARLASIDPGGTLTNRPINSLTEILKPWHYQTLASFDIRIKVLNLISREEPEVGWILLNGMLPSKKGEIASISHQTRWRMFEHKTDKTITYNELFETHTRVIEIALSIFDYSEAKLSELIEISDTLSPIDRSTVLSFVEDVITKVEHKEHLAWNACRETLHKHRSNPNKPWSLTEQELDIYQKLYDTLNPKDDFDQALWLFNEHWPKTPEGYQYKNETFADIDKLILEKRIQVISNIKKEKGIGKIIELSKSVKEPWILGDTVAYVVSEEDEMIQFATGLMEKREDKRFVQSFFYRKSLLNGSEWIFEFFRKLKENAFDNSALAQFLIPYNQTKELWDFIDSENPEIEHEYWANIYPRFYELNAETKVYGLKKLMLNKRTLSAINAIYISTMDPEVIPSDLIVALLKSAATEKSEEKVTIDEGGVNLLFETIDTRQDVNSDTILLLEWMYLPILTSPGNRRIPKRLHDELSNSPEFFIEIFKFIYRPGDEARIEEQRGGLTDEQLMNRAKQAYSLLNSWGKVPGTDCNGEIDLNYLRNWIRTVRLLGAEYGKPDLVDLFVGRVLAQYPQEKNKVWPPAEICIVLEEIDSDFINKNFIIETKNKNGFTGRDPFEGGEQERINAKYYYDLADRQRHDFPIVGDILDRLGKRYECDAQRVDEDAERNKLDY